MNKYLIKIAELSQRQRDELKASKVAGKALLADKAGDVAGLGLGAYIASKLGRDTKKGAIYGAGILGSGLTYASIRHDQLKDLHKKANLFGMGMGMKSPMMRSPMQSIGPSIVNKPISTIGIRG